MIDLSHLTEEEQEMIMAVLRRDAELKKAEEERIRKLEKILSGDSQTDGKLKYLTGEWFYEAKSMRHTDKIHGSEIILASMKQQKAASLDGSLRVERSRMSSSRSSDIVAPQKPARSFEAQLPKPINDAEKENRDSSVCSPRLPRLNPFNRPSLLVVEPPGNHPDVPAARRPDSLENEPVSPLKARLASGAAPPSGGSGTSDGSPVGFRPVPKKRTFLSRRPGNQTAGPGPGPGPGADAPAGSAGVVPAPRRSLQQAATVSSEQPRPKSRGEAPLKDAATASDGISVQSPRPADRCPPPPQRDASQGSSGSSVERQRHSSPEKSGRPAARSRSNVARNRPPSDEPDDQTPEIDRFSPTGSRTETAAPPEEPSLPQSIVGQDPPVSYDLHFIDQSDQPVQKAGQTHVFKLSTQTSSPNGDEEDSIAKVLDWFSRSVDSSEWLDSEEESAKISEVCAFRVEDPSANKKKESQIKRRNTEEDPGRRGGREPIETTGKVKTNEGEKRVDENQTPKISHLKSFWEKSNTGPKILVGKVPKPAQQPAEKESDVLSAPRIHGERAAHDKMSSNQSEERATGPHTNTGSAFHLSDQKLADNPPQRRGHDSTHCSDHSKSLSGPQAAALKTANRLQPESAAPVRSNPPPDSGLETRQESRVVPTPLPDADVQTRRGLDSSRSSPYGDYKKSVNDVQIATKAQNYGEAAGDRKKRDSEDKTVPPKAKEDSLGKDRAQSPHSNRQESTAEKIRQLKSFWEQERNRPGFYSGKPRTSEDGKASRGTNPAKLSKRFTKSEYDLRSLGNESDSGDEFAERNPPNFTIVPLNQRLEKASPGLSASRSQFNTLRDFWDEATSDSKPKSPKRKEPIGSQLPSPESKGGDAEIPRFAEKSRPARSSPSHQARSKSPLDRQTGSRVPNEGRITPEAGQQRPPRRRDEKKPQSSPRRETRAPKGRKDGVGGPGSRGGSLRRATSMFSLSAPDEADQGQPRTAHCHGRKPRPSGDKGVETLTPPLARAFVPTDYRHYLGTTRQAAGHAPLAPPTQDPGEEGQHELSFGARASTPLSGEERHGRWEGRAGQRPLWSAHSGSDAGREASPSSTPEGRSSSRKNRLGGTFTQCEKDEEQNPVKKALWRAELRPKTLAKSMEDISGPLSPRPDRRPDPASELRRISHASSIPSPSSSLCSDSDHLKKMSKSVPSFLQNEDAEPGDEAMFESAERLEEASIGSSMTNISGSSGMKSPLSGSVMTMYSGDFGSVEVQGHIQFSINYIQRLREFHIFVAECSDLAAVEPKRGRSDPYVKSYLVPDKANLGKRKTSVKKKTLNPAFNEILRYRVGLDYLRTQTLILSVWHHDTFGRNSFLGEADLDLSKWDFQHTQMNYFALKARATPTFVSSNGRGEMRLAVRFLPQISHSEDKDGPSTGEIHIWVKECKNLPLIRAAIDPYVKCFVLPDTSRKSRQKTRVLRRTVDPVFNHTMVYDGIREADLGEACVELTVWDRDRLASTLLGGLRLGAGTGRSYGAAVDWMDSSPYEVALWDRMAASPNEWVEGVLPLRVLNSAKTAFI